MKCVSRAASSRSRWTSPSCQHPVRLEQGYITKPNVEPVHEMINMLSASRSYQANVEVMNTSKQLMIKTLTLGES